MQFVISLLLTILLEGAAALVWGIRGRDLVLVTLVNILTNPLVVLVHNLAPGFLWGTLVPELLAVFTEALIYLRKENRIPHPVAFAVTANAFSYLTGVALSALL